MEVVVESPRWSFVKYAHEGGKFVPRMRSVFPTPFNYGYVAGTGAADGMPQDAIVLGRRRSQGDVVRVNTLGTVRFIDDGKQDDKLVTAESGGIELLERVAIHAFFEAYAAFKFVRYLAVDGRLTRCRYGGLTEP